MMQSMVALAVVGVYWVAVGYCLAFGDRSHGRLSSAGARSCSFLQGVEPDELLPGTNIPIYVHMHVPGHVRHHHAGPDQRGHRRAHPLRAVLPVHAPVGRRSSTARWPTGSGRWTGGAEPAERRARPRSAGSARWARSTSPAARSSTSPPASPAWPPSCVLRKRLGYPEHAIHPNSMVLTLTGRRPAVVRLVRLQRRQRPGGSGALAGVGVRRHAGRRRRRRPELDARRVAAHAASRPPSAWRPASSPAWSPSRRPPATSTRWGGLVIGLIAGVVCYAAVCLKPVLRYDDSLDAFGVHGVGGFLGRRADRRLLLQGGQRAPAPTACSLGGEHRARSSTQLIAAGAVGGPRLRRQPGPGQGRSTLVFGFTTDDAGRDRRPGPDRARRSRLRLRPGDGAGAGGRRRASPGPRWCRPTAASASTSSSRA